MKTNLISYSKHYIDTDDIENVVRTLLSPFLTQGPQIKSFERSIKRVTKSKYVISVSSGTAALHLACLALNLKKGDEVITSPLSFVATSNSILYAGAIPVFTDIDEYGLLNPKEVLKKITKKTKAIITVDYAGQPSHLFELKKIARQHNLILIEDAAHSLGAMYKERSVGSIADLTCFSFHPVKLITTGEGGAVSTNNRNFYKKLLLFRNHGITKNKKEFVRPYEGPWQQEMHMLGFNYRMTDIQAALGVSQLKKIKLFIRKRGEIARYYNDQFRALEEKGLVKLVKMAPDRTSAWHLYPLRINFKKKYSKKKLFEYFYENGVRLQVHYPPIHTHPYYIKKFGAKLGDFPHAEQFYAQEVSLPLYPTLTKSQMKKVVQLIRKYIVI